MSDHEDRHEPTGPTATATTTEPAAPPEPVAVDVPTRDDEVLVEEISIDGMCGVY